MPKSWETEQARRVEVAKLMHELFLNNNPPKLLHESKAVEEIERRFGCRGLVNDLGEGGKIRRIDSQLISEFELLIGPDLEFDKGSRTWFYPPGAPDYSPPQPIFPKVN